MGSVFNQSSLKNKPDKPRMGSDAQLAEVGQGDSFLFVIRIGH